MATKVVSNARFENKVKKEHAEELLRIIGFEKPFTDYKIKRIQSIITKIQNGNHPYQITEEQSDEIYRIYEKEILEFTKTLNPMNLFESLNVSQEEFVRNVGNEISIKLNSLVTSLFVDDTISKLKFRLSTTRTPKKQEPANVATAS